MNSQSLSIVFGLVGIYVVKNLLLPRLGITPSASLYWIQPALWMSVAYFCYRSAVNCQTNPILQRKNRIPVLAVVLGVSQVLLYFCTGILTGFGRNPTTPSLSTVLGLPFFIFTSLAGTELSRVQLIACAWKNRAQRIMAVSCFYFFLNISLMSLTSFRVEFNSITQNMFCWLPLFAESLFASVLALKGSAVPAIIFRSCSLVFWYFCPILPNLDPPTKCFLGLIIPFIGALAFLYYEHKEIRKNRLKLYKKFNDEFPLGWGLSGIVIFCVAWFIGGILPIRPLLVASGSMRPSLEVGDIAIVAKIPATNVRLGDILVFQEDTSMIMHRVVAVESTGSAIRFTTKGDANNSIDKNPIEINEVEGKIISVIPKIGRVSLDLKQVFSDSSNH